MEARGRRVGGGFPGYNGPALPRAMRSSRGRGESARRTSGYGGRSGFFELLATVAGQILQDDNGGETEEAEKFAEQGEIVKQKCIDSSDIQHKGSAWPIRASLSEPSSGLSSCLVSLGDAIQDDEAKRLFLEQQEDENVTADSVHSVVYKSNLSCTSQDGPMQALSGAGNNVDIDAPLLSVSHEELKCLGGHKEQKISGSHAEQKIAANHEEQKSLEYQNQILLSVLDNDKIQHLILDHNCGNSVSMDEKVDSSEMSTGRAVSGGLQSPKVEEDVSGHLDEDFKEVEQGVGDHEQTIDMDIDFPKDTFAEQQDPVEVKEPSSSNSVEFPKVEPVEEEMPQLTCVMPANQAESESAGMNSKQCAEELEVKDVGSSLKAAESIRDEDKFAGNEVQVKGICNVKNSTQITDLVLGKGQAEFVGTGYEFSLENVYGKSNDSTLIKESNGSDPPKRMLPEKLENVFGKSNDPALLVESNGSDPPKRMLPEKLTNKLKDSFNKGMKARKVIKMVKRSRVVSSRTKRKHAEMEAAADSDGTQGKKSYFSGMSYTRQRTARGLPAKRKKIADGAPSPSPDLHVNTNLMDLTFDCVDGEPPAAAAKLRSAKAASVASSPTAKGASTKFSKKSGEPHVKLSIKSFTVPELSVDLPETATVSSLKRAVMDAAMNLFGGGLRVRVLLQGKKVPDECATLAQVGISRSAKPDSLGFMLEPSPMPTSPTSTIEDPLLVLSRAAGQPSPRYPVFGAPGLPGGGELGSRCTPKTRSNKGNGGVLEGEVYGASLSGEHIEGKRMGITFSVPQEDGLKGCKGNKAKTSLNDRISLSPHSTRVAAAGALAAIRAQADASRRAAKTESESTSPNSHPMTHDSLMPGSGAIILHPGMNVGENMQGLALVPVRPKSRSMDVGKRRVRRPFSVMEVEALVHAVEKLGTGRWRDVKLRAFDQAKHRTYVDLKDKWKTLVHTARIAPHQRRGEPVPQELLERVTCAHTYWTAQAAKQQAELDY